MEKLLFISLDCWTETTGRSENSQTIPTKREDLIKVFLDLSIDRSLHLLSDQCQKSRLVFEDAGVTLPCRATRCKVLKAIESIRKPKKQPPQSKVSMQKRLVWGKTYLKLDFQNVFFLLKGVEPPWKDQMDFAEIGYDTYSFQEEAGWRWNSFLRGHQQ